MQLTRREFEDRYRDGSLRLALIGMSNIGKSYTGMRLATGFDFTLIEIDKIIWQRLGKDSMSDFAAWQGQPYSDGYAEREAYSTSLEDDATTEALVRQTGNAILDTTGSVIYTSEKVLRTLQENWFVVHISASAEALERLKDQYFKQPKPLIWNGHYKCRPGQTPQQAILTSYPHLLKARAKAYSALADITVSSDIVLDATLSVEDIFEALKPAV